MYLKKCLALLVSAALALSLLAGCGGSKALSQVIADLLSGQYNNVTVEVDPDLTAALKKAASAGDTQEEVLAALVENLNLSGGSITFSNLGDGQQGQHGVTLTFQPGSDPEAAARSAFTEWNRVFSSLPDDGSYRAHVSMIETEGGYYIAVDVEVLKAGSHDKDDPVTLTKIVLSGIYKIEYIVDETFDKTDLTVTAYYSNNTSKVVDNYSISPSGALTVQDDTVTITYEEYGQTASATISIAVTDPGFKMNGDTYEVYNADGLQAWAEAVNGGAYSANCTLTSDINLSGITWETVCYGSNAYSGVFDGDNHTISNLNVKKREWNGVDYSYSSPYGLFGNVGTGGTIKDVTVSGSINLTDRGTIGMIAGKNCGQIINCHSEGSVSGKSNVGGIAGYNEGGTIEGCTVSGNITAKDEHSFVGGITGGNNYSSKVIGCSFDNGTVNGNNYVGGIVASNNNGSQIIACYAKGTIQGSSKVGGVVGNQLASTKDIVIGCYFTGSSTGNEYVGGVAGLNELAQCLNACYWNGSATGGLGVGQGNLSRGEAEKVSDDESWDNAVAAMNTAISSYGYRFGGTMSAPSLSN